MHAGFVVLSDVRTSWRVKNEHFGKVQKYTTPVTLGDGGGGGDSGQCVRRLMDCYILLFVGADCVRASTEECDKTPGSSTISTPTPTSDITQLY